MKIRDDYDEENDIFSMNWGKVKHSRELLNDRIVFDFDKKNNIVGFEFFGFMKEIRKSDKEVEKIFKIYEKKKWKKKK